MHGKLFLASSLVRTLYISRTFRFRPRLGESLLFRARNAVSKLSTWSSTPRAVAPVSWLEPRTVLRPPPVVRAACTPRHGASAIQNIVKKRRKEPYRLWDEGDGCALGPKYTRQKPKVLPLRRLHTHSLRHNAAFVGKPQPRPARRK